MSNIDNLNLDYLKRKQNINNPFKDMDRSIKSYINRPINNKSEYEIPLSMMSNYNFPLKSGLASKYFEQTNDPRITSISNNNIKSKELYMNYLKNRLNYFYKSNTELNDKYKYIANKSKLLIDNISNNKNIFNNLKKNYENSIKNNLELKQKYNNLLEQYKRQLTYGDNSKNKEQNEIYNLQKEQNILLSTVKSKEEIIDNLKKTLSIINEEVEENKNDTGNDNKKHKINVLKKVLDDLTFKINDNKKNISILNGKINELNNEKYLLNDNNNKNKFHNIDEFKNKNEHIYLKDEEYKNISKDKKNILMPKMDLDKNNNFNYNSKLSSKLKKLSSENNNDEMNLELSFGNNEVKEIPAENINSNSATLDHYNYFNKYKNIEDDIVLNILHKKNQSVELDDNNKLILNKSNDNNQMNDKYVVSRTLDIEDIKNQKLTSLKNKNIINKTKTANKNETNQFQNSSYLFTITKEGTFIEFDILEKIYTINDTSQIKDWNPFISEYLNNFDGSLLLNTFQGLFICTGKFYNDLYYYSKKFNSISKLKTFNHNHKYGALMLSSDNDTLLLIGGETNNIETLNFENGSIGMIPPLLKKRINSSYAFVGNILFAFFGKNNNTIEYLDMNSSQKWEIFDYKINIDNENENDIDKNINLDGHAAIPLIGDEVLIIGGNQNNKMIIFNYNEKSIEIADIDIPLIDNVGEYRFDKDKYFNVFIGTEKSEIEGNSLNQLIGMDLMGNIHYFDNNLDYSVVLFNNEKP